MLTMLTMLTIITALAALTALTLGASGERLKEGAQINLSLHTLGNVINALTDAKRKSAGSRPD